MSELKYQIFELRNHLKISQQAFADRLTESSGKKYTRSSVNNWEQGQGIKGEDIVNICNCFHVSADSLLFPGPIRFRSDDQSIINAADYTGLSHKAISVLHELHDLGYDMSALNALLERVSFYRTVLDYVGKAVDSIGKTHSNEYEPSDQEGEAAVLLSSKGWITLDPDRALGILARNAGAELDRELNSIKDERENPYLAKFSNSRNDTFIQGLKMVKEAE